MTTAGPQLPQRPLGETGISVSTLGLGTVKFGRTAGLRYPHPFELPTAPAIAELLAHAGDRGLNLVDTAPAYGEAEERLGAALAGRRDAWVLCTKTGEIFDGRASSFDFGARHTRASIEGSLTRLRTDVIDIALVHSDGDDLTILREHEVLDELATLKAEGKVRAIGMSVKTLEGALSAIAQCDVLMLTLNAEETELLPVAQAARRRGCGILVKKPLASGHRAQHVRKDLAWLAGCAGVTSVVLGTLSPQHLDDAATAVASVGY